MSSSSQQKKSKILLAVCDNQQQSELQTIISQNYTTICFSSETQIIDALKFHGNDISAAIIDINIALPILNEIIKNSSLAGLPILISTDQENSDKEDELLNLDAIDFLKTPFNKRRVLNRIKMAIQFSEVQKAIQDLEHDELTGLLTRKAFIRKAESLKDEYADKTLCVIAFDFDNFKTSNTMYGVEKCNEFLAYTARQMMEKMPKGIAGRYGGDQFIILVEYEETVDVELINKISKEILCSAPIPHQVVKIGIYAPFDFELPIVINCDRAFLAINSIKGKYGKNLAFFESSLQNKLLNEQSIIETMERALEEKQFKVFYQPKHETITGNIAGAEALVRWNHPDYGFMQPGQFIPLFEKNGFITKLDTFMVEQVAKDIKRWQTDGYPLVPISINVSRRDFFEPECIEKQTRIIDRHEIDHSLIHMEVTESMYSENPELIIAQVKKMQEQGFMIEMDDFGAGYSTLGMLSSFPINIIKLDISFVRNIKTNEVVIENIIKMAHRLGYLTVAEGVETDEQFKILKTLGCDFIQGFYFSKPLATNDYERYLKKTSILPIGKINLPPEIHTTLSPLNENMLLAASEVAEGVPGGFFTYHADGNLELISYNHELMNIYGCSSADEFRDFIGNSFKGIVYEEDFDRVQASIERQIKQHNDLDFVEYRIKTKDGRIRYVEDYGRFVRTNTYGDIFYVFIRDITDEWNLKAQAEADLVRKIELQRLVEFTSNSNKAKDIFMSNISRDIISTMRKIIAYTKDIDGVPHGSKTIQGLVTKTIKEEENLLGFINNVSELAQIESNELEVIEKPTDLHEATERTYDLVKNEAKSKNIKIEHWSEIKNYYIYQDLIHTTTAVLNILRNAIKYTPEGGYIRFGLKQTPLPNPEECNIDFICEDTGIGISPEFLPFVCKMFAREDNDINKDIPSSGLGMNIVKQLAQLMNGSLTITSELGKGTKVVLSIPHRYAKKEDVESESTLIGNLKSKEKD